MRLSIWQQFSSNHSSNFTAVGRFDTPEKAAAARQTFEQMLRAIYAAQEARSACGVSFSSYYDPPTDVESDSAKTWTWTGIQLRWIGLTRLTGRCARSIIGSLSRMCLARPITG
jgi:hypothetical protein